MDLETVLVSQVLRDARTVALRRAVDPCAVDHLGHPRLGRAVVRRRRPLKPAACARPLGRGAVDARHGRRLVIEEDRWAARSANLLLQVSI